MIPVPRDLAKRNRAAADIGELINRIFTLAPTAGLYVGIRIEPAHIRVTDAKEDLIT